VENSRANATQMLQAPSGGRVLEFPQEIDAHAIAAASFNFAHAQLCAAWHDSLFAALDVASGFVIGCQRFPFGLAQ
jgi:hypothetical protein